MCDSCSILASKFTPIVMSRSCEVHHTLHTQQLWEFVCVTKLDCLAKCNFMFLQTQKQIRILENRLEKMYHKYNESKSRNQVLRTGIDNLRRERLVFDDIHRKLAKSLLVKKKEMAGVIAHTNHILEGRDKVRHCIRLTQNMPSRRVCVHYKHFACLELAEQVHGHSFSCSKFSWL